MAGPPNGVDPIVDNADPVSLGRGRAVVLLAQKPVAL